MGFSGELIPAITGLRSMPNLSSATRFIRMAIRGDVVCQLHLELSKNWWYPNSWMVYVMEHPMKMTDLEVPLFDLGNPPM